MELYYPDVLRMFCLFGYEAIFISNVSYPVIVKLNLAFITPDRIRFYKTDNFFSIASAVSASNAYSISLQNSSCPVPLAVMIFPSLTAC